MYFEDIYKIIRSLWRDSYSLESYKNGTSHIPDLSKHWNKLDDFVSANKSGNYNEWHSMLVWTMYQALTTFGITKRKNSNAKEILVDEVPMLFFEKYFKDNLEADGNESFLLLYKGFRNS